MSRPILNMCMIRIFFLIAESWVYNLHIYIKVDEYEKVKYVNGFIYYLSKIKQQFSKKLMRLSKRLSLKSQPIRSVEMSLSNMAASPTFPLFSLYLF